MANFRFLTVCINISTKKSFIKNYFLFLFVLTVVILRVVLYRDKYISWMLPYCTSLISQLDPLGFTCCILLSQSIILKLMSLILID